MSKNTPATALDLIGGLKLQKAAPVVKIFQDAAKANRDSTLRKGSTAHLPEKGNLLMTGDLHDNAVNLARIVHLAKLDDSTDNHVVLHEIVHGENKIDGRDMSVRLLAKVAALKVAYPDQVHVMLGNHELAQLAGEGILKGGESVVELFDDGLDFLYADDAEKVRQAMNAFIRSMLLAVRCPNDILCSHSLPSPRQLDRFDPDVLNRDLTDEDLEYRGSAYDMVWGRNHTQQLADDLADDWNVRLFVMGHQPADMGYEIQGDTMLILNSDDNHGMAMTINLSHRYETIDDLIGELIPLASVMV